MALTLDLLDIIYSGLIKSEIRSELLREQLRGWAAAQKRLGALVTWQLQLNCFDFSFLGNHLKYACICDLLIH